MLTQREILSTLEMLKNEHLDVRTVTLGVNLLDCASHDPEKLKNLIQTLKDSPMISKSLPGTSNLQKFKQKKLPYLPEAQAYGCGKA